MGQGTLTIYSASAGSGKTYRLTEIYLSAILKSKYNYRKILAVTFTNKATAEMKSRILDHLSRLAGGEESEYLSVLLETTGKNEELIRSEAKEILNSILHDFSRFSVSTIDSFFQKVLRSFTREIGIHSGYNVELDHTVILSNAIDEMIESASEDKQLRDWLLSYTRSNIEDEKSWDLKKGITILSEELFKEKFKLLSHEERLKLEDKNILLAYINKIRSIIHAFENQLTNLGKNAEGIFSKYNLTEDLFYQKAKGVPSFVKALAAGNIKDPNSYVRETQGDPPKWTTGKISPQLEEAVNNGLGDVLKEAIIYFDNNISGYRSAKCVLANIFELGILSDVLHKVHQITTNENLFLLSDTGELLNLITREDQAPFIYEKIGNRFENFMIDEFQDTSIIQWKNFKPLIENSMAEGFDNLVVGDIKQSIYRWRNSDWRILGTVLQNMVDDKRIFSVPLDTNWRSRSNLLKFNNTLFTIIPEQTDKNFEDESMPQSFRKLYSQAVQKDPGNKDGGYVRIEFIDNDKEEDWRPVVLEKLPTIVESLQDKGYKASDIGIIVRTGNEGAQVLERLISYSESCDKTRKLKYNYNAISNDSLLLSKSPVIIFIISVISVINDPPDQISRAIMLRFFLLSTGREGAEQVSLRSDRLSEISKEYFPEGFEDLLDRVRQMPLFEATENIIKFFGLGDYFPNIPFLNSFQDYVVNFAGSKNSDFQSFLDWWEESGNKKSVILPGNQDAIRILTIHKSKGLEFKVVILPFLAWNLDHLNLKQPVLWVKPSSEPFNELGIVPVKYGKDLEDTIFEEDYKEEKYSVYLDSINLLYVAFTRAKDVIYGFSTSQPKKDNIAGALLNAISMTPDQRPRDEFSLHLFYDIPTRVFEYGKVPDNESDKTEKEILISLEYKVSQTLGSLKLKLHGENYFSSEGESVRKRINYGKLMHEIFEGINAPPDISSAVRKLVLEGKLSVEESVEIEKRVNQIIKNPRVAGWFEQGNTVLREAGILLPTGFTRRPDRVIFKDGKTIIIDFKFGEENPHYPVQIDQYRHLLEDMGYKDIEGYIWYVDNNKIVTV
jgi:ATP-dependent helicase/nuclease subunit A